MKAVMAANRCRATWVWSRGISSGLDAMLNPVPIGLSRKRSPKIRFQEPGLGSRANGWSGVLRKLTRHGPSSKKFPIMEEQPGPPWSQMRSGVWERGEVGF
ncbi:hypothetical protein TorRG33x02_059890 [Trema orientale]|uniref:Uncharacterized protein n=1 Tax=Trema orientale TaxID=63057 RepID=A0A2P5FK50_TREOI|nr:hypothetical protein TorRG33x02_059890 [Trema orientale]